jgi:uncharacterized protein (DUF111 family)
MTTSAVGIGAGGRNPAGLANVLRILVDDGSAGVADSSPLLLETNVDDLDPRVWPSVIGALLEAGASDAWLTPILMKKGRPAHTLSVLVPADRAAVVRETVFRQTSTIGLREQTLTKRALDRTMDAVVVDGHRIAVKLAHHDGHLVNAQPEYDDVARAAAELGRPVSDVLAAAIAATRNLLEERH